MDKARKAEIVAKHSLHEGDTGSPEVQIALLTERITHLTGHLQEHKKDFHTRHGLLKLVGQRRRMLDYLKDRDIESYRDVIRQLGLRR
ncbi:MAG: 30S ribosomal protein S15 [bacterium]|nr:30S ribosomal protein S15 [bacterium]